MKQVDFTNALEDYIGANSLTPYSMFATIGDKNRIIGLALFWARGRILETSDIIWFPWATPRLILESYVNFVNSVRKQNHEPTGMPYVILEYARENDAKYFDHVCRYGIMRRVGTSEEIYPAQKCCVYESRSLKNAK